MAQNDVDDFQKKGGSATMKRMQKQDMENMRREMAVRSWIGSMLEENIPEEDLSDLLSDGIILCRLANAIQPKSVARIQTKSTPDEKLPPHKKMQNAMSFLQACRAFGIPNQFLFIPSDLFEGKEILKVTKVVNMLQDMVVNKRPVRPSSLAKVEQEEEKRQIAERQKLEQKILPVGTKPINQAPTNTPAVQTSTFTATRTQKDSQISPTTQKEFTPEPVKSKSNPQMPTTPAPAPKVASQPLETKSSPQQSNQPKMPLSPPPEPKQSAPVPIPAAPIPVQKAPQELSRDGDDEESEDRSQPQYSEAGSEVDPNEDLTQAVPRLVRKKSISYASGSPYGHQRQYSRQYSVVSKKGGRAHAPSISSQRGGRTEEEKRERKERKKKEREAEEAELKKNAVKPPIDDDELEDDGDQGSETASVRLRTGSIVELGAPKLEAKSGDEGDEEQDEESDEDSQEEEPAAQPSWVRSNSINYKDGDDEALKGMGEREKKMKLREEVVGDIFDNEEQYVSQLRVIDQLYIKGLEKGKEITNVELGLIFSNIREILQFHEVLWQDFQEVVMEKIDDPASMCVGRIYTRINDATKLYLSYVYNHAKGLATFNSINETNASFKLFLEYVKNKPQIKGMTVPEFLFKPIEQVYLYPAMFEAVLECTPEDHPDYADCMEAFQMMEELASEANEKELIAENFQKLREVQSKFEGLEKEIHLVAPNRWFLREGWLKMVTGKNKLEEMCFHLFSDLLVISKYPPEGGIFAKKNKQICLECKIPFRLLALAL